MGEIAFNKVEKTGRKSIRLSDKSISILRWLALNFPVKRIAKRFNISIKTVYKHRSNFIKKGFINRYNELIEEGRKIIYYDNKEDFRLNNVRVSIDVPQQYREKLGKIRYNLLTLKKIYFEREYLGNKIDYPIFSLDRAIVRVYQDKITIRMPDIWERTAEDCTDLLLELIFEYISKLEKLYKIELICDDKLNLAIVSNDYANIRNILAEKYRNENNVFYLRDKNKELRIIIDFSHKLPELEAVHKNYAERDIVKVNKQINDWIENDPPTNSELNLKIKKLFNLINSTSTPCK